MAVASLLGSVGGSQAILAELPTKPRGHSTHEWSGTVTAFLVFTSATSAVVALATVVSLGMVGNSRFLYHETFWIVVFVVGVIATTASQLLENIWVAERRAGWFLGASSAFSLVKLVLVAVPGLAVFGAAGILSIWSITLAVTVVGCLIVLARLYGFRPRLTSVRKQIWSMRQTMTGNYVISVGDQLTLYLIPVLVAAGVSPDSAGWFYAAWKIGGFYAVFASAVGTAAFVEGSHAPDRALSVAISGMKLITPLIVLGSLTTLLGGHLVLRIFGPAYATHAYLLLVLLSLAALPDAVVNIYRSVLRVHRRYAMASSICWSITGVRLALTWELVSLWGIVGAGWAWLITQTAGSIWCALDLMWHRNDVFDPRNSALQPAGGGPMAEG
jgi:O-antigen/teichoic acid export membrane protein